MIDMDFDFPLILVALTFACGLGWLLDLAFFKKPREEKIASVRKQMGLSVSDEASGEQQAAIDKVAKEPALIEMSKSFFPVFFVVLVLRSFLAEPFQIPSGSMLPTLNINDFILVNKYEYGLRLPVVGTKVIPFKDPARGDVMVFKFPNNPKINFIKRVVGVPGDRITYRNKSLYINGELIEEKLIQAPGLQSRSGRYTEDLGNVIHEIYKDSRPAKVNKTWLVPEGHYFVMGDNRDNSNDSRFWGFVPDELVVGKAFAVWMHWEGVTSLPDFGQSRWIE
jgi:signal peptidase I